MTELRHRINRRYENGSARQDALDDLDRLLARFEIVEVDRAVATAAADIITALQRRGEPLHDLHDVYVGATAAVEKLPVLTTNVDHFERMDDIGVIDWTTF